MEHDNAKYKMLLPILLLGAFFIFTQSSHAATPASSIDTDTTWTKANSPYVVTGAISVSPRVTLTIEPGVVVKFNVNSPLIINGIIHAQGTEIEKIYFTSIKDDAVGGDTNGDGSASTPAPRDWKYVQFISGSSGSFSYFVIRYAGWLNCSCAIDNSGGTIDISDSELALNGSQGVLQQMGTTTIARSVIRNHIWGFRHRGGNTILSKNTFRDNDIGVVADFASLALTNNNFINNTSAAAKVSASVNFAHSGNTSIGGLKSGLLMGGGVFAANQTIWNADSLPYIVSGDFIIPSGQTLTIQEGAIVKFDFNGVIRVSGSLNVSGSAANNIHLTSLKDDTVGGDTNGDGTLTFPAPKDWRSIRFNLNSTGGINYASIRYAGYITESGISCGCGVDNEGGVILIQNSELTRNYVGAIQDAGTFTISQSAIYDNPGGGMLGGGPDIANAKQNWWGSPSGPYHPIFNPLGTGDSLGYSFNIDFIPWLGYDPTKNQPPTLSELGQFKSDGVTAIAESVITNESTVIFKATLSDLNNDQVKLQVELRKSDEPFTGADDGGIVTSDAVSSGSEAMITRSGLVKGIYKWRARAADNKGATSEWQEFGTVGSNDFEVKSGHSSVAFLPGLEASRLYKPGTLFENQLWEPNRNDDVRELYLNPDGTPQQSNIYTRDDIDRIYGALNNIYANFNNSMRTLVDDKVINEFETIPYDWRFQLDDVLASGKEIGMDSSGRPNFSYTEATTSPYIIQEIERLARNSATGKTTIIAHSNGGLLAKRLMKKLEEKGEANIIDKIIFVAVPQTGTPAAVAVLLHGHDQALGFGFVLTKSNARTFAENMPSAYNLLPDQKYFTDVSTPVVTFDPLSSVTQSFRDAYGTAITNREELLQFITGIDGRIKPAPDDTDNPNILNSMLLERSRTFQDELDAWTPPEGVEVIQIAGWGSTTLSGIAYTEREDLVCSLSSCLQTKLLDYKPEFVVDGDGTVVIPSAFAMGTSTGKAYYVNLSEYNEDHLVNRKHESILEVQSLEKFIADVIKNREDILPVFISTTAPHPKVDDLVLRFAVHSPVSLDLYDTAGRHTGIASSTLPYSDIQLIDEQIPNSYYMEFGEGKYGGADGVGTTTVQLIGQGLGSFTFDIEETHGNTVVASTTFAGIPVTASTTAVLDILNLSASSTPMLRMDIDGDGTTDVNISSGDGVSTEELLYILRGVIKTLDLPLKKETKLLKDIDKVERALEKDDKDAKKKERKQKRHTEQAFKEIEKTITKFEKKNLLTKDEAEELIIILEEIKVKVVK